MSESCKKMVVSLKKGSVPYQCRRPHYADGWCFMHHPQNIAEGLKSENAELRKKLWEIERYSKNVDMAIALLVRNGFFVQRSNNKGMK